MNYKVKYLHCEKSLLESLKQNIEDVFSVINSIEWEKDFEVNYSGKILRHQTAYNKVFEIEFEKLGWEKQPLLSNNPKLIGDFQKKGVFVEVQFGNSATLYRDYYKFQYGFQKGLLSLCILIVPDKPIEFFPNRVKSVNNMAEYDLALRYFTIIPVSIPTVIIGLNHN